MWGIAASAFIGMFQFGIPLPVIVLGAALLGLIGGELWPASFVVISPGEGNKNDSVLNDVE